MEPRKEMSIAVLYDRLETDEVGIKLTAEEMGINLTYIPFRKISVCLGNDGFTIRSKGKNYSKIFESVDVILNRAQSKNRRLFAASVIEAFGKHVLNPLHVEFVCFSKLRTLLHLWKEGIKIPKTVYVPCDPHEYRTDGGTLYNGEDIADLIQQELNGKHIVVKPDAGTHGKDVKLAKEYEELLMILRKVKPSIINSVGVLAQEFIQKWFYDLRIVVYKEFGKSPRCHPKALARAGFKDFRTNAYLGNMVFGVNLPASIRERAVWCAETIGKNNRAWVLALDAMINVDKDKVVNDKYVKSELDKLTPYFNAIRKVKSQKNKKEHFSNWNRKLEEVFQVYMSTEPYENVKEVIEESVQKKADSMLFHEVNSCPEFWEQTRLIAGINLAVPLLKCAQSSS